MARVEAATFQVGGGKAVKSSLHATKMQVRSAVSPITIDGKMDELRGAAQSLLPHFADLTVSGWVDMRTQLKVLHDDSVVYFGFIVSKGRVSTYVNRDDTLWKQDAVEIYLDPDGDGRNYLELQVSPKNVIRCAIQVTSFTEVGRSEKLESCWGYNGGIPGRVAWTS